MIAVTFAYDGDAVAQAIVTGADVGGEYIFYTTGGFTSSTTQDVVASTADFTLEIPDITGTAGNTTVLMFERTDSSPLGGTGAIASAVIRLGHSGGPFPFQPGVLAWSYDGDKTISLTLDTSAPPHPAGDAYYMAITAYTGDGTWPATGFTQKADTTPADAGLQTLTVVLDDSPAPGLTFAVRFVPTLGVEPFGDGLAFHMFTGGTADAGFDVPFTEEYDPAVAVHRHEVTVSLYDLGSNLLADISPVCLEKSFRRRMNAVTSVTIQAPAASSLFTDVVSDDGLPNLRKGNRKLYITEDGTPIFHGRIWMIERVGDGTENTLTITAYQPWAELGFEGDDRAGRPVRDNTGNFIDPDFSYLDGGSGIDGPSLIQDILTNSENTDPTLGEGPTPIDLSLSIFDTGIPPNVDLTPSDSMDWPILVGDFVQQLVDTGLVDIDEVPLAIGESSDPYKMTKLVVSPANGTDRSATVHFDYWTGSYNAKAVRHVEDFSTINNKLFDYLGPKLDKEHWRGNFAPDSPGVIPDPSTSRARYGGPPGGDPDDAGSFASIRVSDYNFDNSIALSGQPGYALALALYNAELGYRIEPRDLLFITPNPDAKALFEAPADYDVGDVVAINVGAALGVSLAATQQVHGYDKQWDREGIARIGQLLTSADAA